MTSIEDVERITANRQKEKRETERELTDLFLRIADIYICNSAKRGYSQTVMHCDPTVEKRVIECLLCEGYRVKEHSSSCFIIAWGNSEIK